MKKLIILFTLFLMCRMAYGAPISTDAFTTSSDLTISRLESMRTTFQDAINNADGGRLQAATVTATKLDANANPENFRNEAFSDWVYSGLLFKPVSGSLTSTISAGTAYIYGARVVKVSTDKTFTAQKWTYVDLNNAGTLTYVETDQGVAEPATTANSLRLCRVSTDGIHVGQVRDDRPVGISIGSTQEDFYRINLDLTVVTPDALTIQPGVVYHGTTRVAKTTTTSLALGTAADWATGISGRAINTTGYVVCKSNGTIKLTTSAPAYSNTSGGTTGKLLYSLIGTDYWRVLSWFRMNAVGSGNIDDWGYSEISDNGERNRVYRRYVSWDVGFRGISRDDTIPEITQGTQFMSLGIVPTDSTATLRVRGIAQGCYAGDVDVVAALFRASGTNAVAVAQGYTLANKMMPLPIFYECSADTTSYLEFKVRMGGDETAQLFYFNGEAGHRMYGGITKSYLEIEEIE